MTEKRKQHHPLSGGSRISAYTFDPKDLVLITDAHDPLYDKRVEDPLDRGFLLSIADKGVLTPISVRHRNDENVVVWGKQRTKGVHAVNALAAGVPYTGPVQAIHVAIRVLATDTDFVKKVTLFTGGRPLKIRAVPANSGDERSARLAMRSENAHRHGDVQQERMRFVHEEHEKYGTSIEELARAENVSEATVKRWVKRGADSPRPKKRRGKAARPSIKQVEALVEEVRTRMTAREQILIDWIAGRKNGLDVKAMFTSTATPSADVRAQS